MEDDSDIEVQSGLTAVANNGILDFGSGDCGGGFFKPVVLILLAAFLVLLVADVFPDDEGIDRWLDCVICRFPRLDCNFPFSSLL